MNTEKTPNHLMNESSPYLLQHAYNPVEWYPWKEEALSKARSQNKPIIVSIGYSACHWCHVMEQECFEDPEVAEIMNRYFINIKVDREERPDVDQVYMEAVQAMGMQGGWPLNVFLTADGEPFYGGTYFPKPNWISLLMQVQKAYSEHEEEIKEQAGGLTKSLNRSEFERFGIVPASSSFSTGQVQATMEEMKDSFDRQLGGFNRAPKFPMPTIYRFLLRSFSLNENQESLEHALFTLRCMARGGIYDQIGGGFARYSVDKEWLVPHFEKMLYDNAQLLSLYSEAYAISEEKEFLKVVEKTIAFAERELQSDEGGFFSALDADSEGEEGKFYVWTSYELKLLLKEEYSLFAQYFQITENGNWEEGKNILHRVSSPEEFAEKYALTTALLEKKLAKWERLLLAERNRRIRPGLDDKILCGWNGLMLKGLCDAMRFAQNPKAKAMADKLAAFLADRFLYDGCRLWHTYKNGKAAQMGFLEDYAAVIQGFLAFYQTTFEVQWLEKSEALTAYVMEHFFDPEENLFWFTDDQSEKLIARKKELFDNVIPSSNSMMAENLLTLSALTGKREYQELAGKMTAALEPLMVQYGKDLSNWASVYSWLSNGSLEVAIIGQFATEEAEKLQQSFLPFTVFAAVEKEAQWGLLAGRKALNEQTTFYVCREGACQLPVTSREKAIELMKSPNE